LISDINSTFPHIMLFSVTSLDTFFAAIIAAWWFQTKSELTARSQRNN